MSQPAQVIALLLMEHVRNPFVGPVLTYGKQAMNIGYEGMLQMFGALNLQPHPEGTIAPPPPDEYIDFARFVKLLGLGEPQTLDVSNYEGAEIIADLNLPVPPEFAGRYGWVVDGGTIEHVFDLRQGMRNTADLLRPGGRVVHMSPSNNYVNHGFVQLSPAFYHDYYVANGFEDVRGIMVVQPRADTLSLGWNMFEYDPATMGGANSLMCTEQTQLALYFSARKTAASTSDRVPVQPAAVGAGERRGPQFLVTHNPEDPSLTNVPAIPNVRLIEEPDRRANVPVHELVHVGFGSGRRPAAVPVDLEARSLQ